MIMNRTLLILLFMCTLIFAMVPRNRFSREVRTCAYQTPCAWIVYDTFTKNIIQTFNNTYCRCADELACVKSEDEVSKSTYVFRCRSEPELEDS